MGAVAAGRIGTVVAFVLLPLIGIAVGQILAGRVPAAPRGLYPAPVALHPAPRGVGRWPADRGGRGLRAPGLADRGGRRRRGRRGLALARPGDRDQRGDRGGGAGRAAPAVDVPPARQPVSGLPRGRPAAARAGRRGPGPRVRAAAQPGRPRTAARLGHRRARPARVLRAAGPPAAAPGLHRMGHRAGRAGDRTGGKPRAGHGPGRHDGQRLAGPSDRIGRRRPPAGRHAGDRVGRPRARPAPSSPAPAGYRVARRCRLPPVRGLPVPGPRSAGPCWPY